ncbi:MAG: YcgN family cysteine cluster protein [Alphaproteobacteria bacterium]
MSDPFWRVTPLSEMTEAEWESLCDGCGRCCLHKLADEDTGEVSFTNVACFLLDLETCACRDYGDRRRQVPDCVQLEAVRMGELDWLPSTCAYRLLYAGRDLPPWHPLVSGDPETVHAAGMSVRGRAISEKRSRRGRLLPMILAHHIVDWWD